MGFPPCVRCGMCCIISPCTFSEMDDGDACPYLTINEDDTTTCNNEDAVAAYAGQNGCLFQSPNAAEIYDLQLELSNVTERKQMIKEAQ